MNSDDIGMCFLALFFLILGAMATYDRVANQAAFAGSAGVMCFIAFLAMVYFIGEEIEAD